MSELQGRILQACEQCQFELALELTQWGLNDNPDEGSLWELQGLIQYSLRNFPEAVDALERATLLKPLTDSARICLGQAYGRIGLIELSTDLLKGLVSKESLTAGLLLQLASALDELNHPEFALQACRRATSQDPLNAQAYYDMGYYSGRCGCPPHVTESLARKAISLNPENIHYQVGLTSLLVRHNRTQEALIIVRHYSAEQIEQIHCRCCLTRILELFEFLGDDQRISLCRSRLSVLEENDLGSDCE